MNKVRTKWEPSGLPSSHYSPGRSLVRLIYINYEHWVLSIYNWLKCRSVLSTLNTLWSVPSRLRFFLSEVLERYFSSCKTSRSVSVKTAEIVKDRLTLIYRVTSKHYWLHCSTVIKRGIKSLIDIYVSVL